MSELHGVDQLSHQLATEIAELMACRRRTTQRPGIAIRFIHLALLTSLIIGACTSGPEAATSISADTSSPATRVTSPDPTKPPTSTPEPEEASFLFVGGPILTSDKDRPIAEALAVAGNLIIGVGTEEELTERFVAATVVDLEGRSLLPGFVDAHSHYYQTMLGDGMEPEDVQDVILSAGVTTTGELGVDANLLEMLRDWDNQGRLEVRTSVYLLHDNACGEESGDWILGVIPDRTPGKRLHVGGVKVFTDGGSCNAPAVSFESAFGGHGDLYYDAGEVAAIIEKYDAAGFQVAIHALGDRAVEATLDGLESVIGESENPLRHRIEHNAVVRPEMRDRYDEVGAVPVIFGSFATCAYLGLDPRFRFRSPLEYQEWEWPWRDLLDLNPNTTFAWHADFPVFAESNPVASLAGFVTRYQELDDGTTCEPEPYHYKHAITVEEALQLMTINSAYALHRETEVGSLEVGKMADLVVLSADPLSVDPRQLFDLKVELTMLDGEPVHCTGDLEFLCNGATVEPEVDPDSDEPTASAFLPTNPPGLAVDGDVETHWTSGDDAPQWIEIPLGGETEVLSVTLVIDQYPAGPTRHIVWGRTSTGDLIELAQISGDTDMLDVLKATADIPWLVTAIRIETVESPSWVSWREVEIEFETDEDG